MARPCIPPAMRRVNCELTLSPETWEAVRELAARRSLNLSRMTETLIWEALRSRKFKLQNR